jgi:PAS domain S-box-containing protein
MKYYYSYIPDDIVLIHIEDITEKKDYENKLKLSEKRYRTLAENLPCLIFRVLWQENRKLVFFNNMLEHITGYKTLPATKGEIFSLDTLILKEDIKKTITDIKSAILKNKSFNIECRLIHKDEHIIYCQMLGQPIYDDNNNLIFIDGFLIDITQKKIYENELKIKNNEIEAQNEELKVAHEELSIAYSTINQRQRELEEINKQLQNINNQLKESEQLKHLAYEELNNIFQAVNLPMFIIDIEYNITKINQQGKEFFKSINCDIDSSIGNKCYHVLHKMKSLPYFCLAKDMISKNSNLPISKEINIGNKCFLLNCSAILDHNGNVKEIIHVLTKIDKT